MTFISHNAVFVLQALLHGVSVRFGRRSYSLTDGNELGIHAVSTENGVKTSILLPAEVTIGNFITMCENLPEEELARLRKEVSV